jgi:hypothetical protein
MEKWLLPQKGSQYAILEPLQSLAKQFDIEIVSATAVVEGSLSHGKIEWRNQQEACDLLTAELGIYPTSIIKASKLRRIIVCSKLRVNEISAGGALKGEFGTLYLSLEDRQGSGYRRLAFHHELFHCIDYNDDALRYLDPDWTRLNEPGFSYSSFYRNSNKQNQIVNRLGFTSHYAMSAVQEDKAELYAHMIMHYKAVERQAKSDPILKRKIDRMKQLLTHFCSDYNESFWSARRLFSHPLSEEHISIVDFKLWEETVGRQQVWFVEFQNSHSSPKIFYSKATLTEFLTSLEIADFEEVRALLNGRKQVEMKARVSNVALFQNGIYIR